eukprot:6179045-Pleurochrysis_carterae.AAC.7
MRRVHRVRQLSKAQLMYRRTKTATTTAYYRSTRKAFVSTWRETQTMRVMSWFWRTTPLIPMGTWRSSWRRTQPEA